MQIILADDQTDVRSAIRLMLEEKPDISIVGEASTSFELLKQTRLNNPDLIMLDWELPGTSAKELVSLLQVMRPGILIIALSSSPMVRHIALKAGVRFVCKSDPPETLLKAVDDCLKNS